MGTSDKISQESVSKLRTIERAIDTIACYGKFTEGQDGFAAILAIKKCVGELLGEQAPYGFCPHCGAKGVARERRMDGNDNCANGHCYPSKVAR